MAEHIEHILGTTTSRRIIRDDAVKLRTPTERWYVPTTDKTKWVGTWAEFKAAGGVQCFNEDQTGIELTLPAPYKFGIKFPDESLS